MSVGVIDTFVAILAGLIIFPAAFSVGIQPDAGPSLIFITLPNVFQQAFGGIPFLAMIFSLLFYVLLALAALKVHLISLPQLIMWLNVPLSTIFAKTKSVGHNPLHSWLW